MHRRAGTLVATVFLLAVCGGVVAAAVAVALGVGASPALVGLLACPVGVVVARRMLGRESSEDRPAGRTSRQSSQLR